METLNLLIRGQNYTVRKTGSGKPVLLLHGFTGSGESWKDFVGQNPVGGGQVGLQWIVPDLLGHGGTSAPPSWERYEMGEQTTDLAEMMTCLGFQEFACCGYSLGGRVALALAIKYPARVSALVVESGSPGLASESERDARQHRDNALASRLAVAGIDQFVREWEEIPLFASQKDLSEESLQAQREIRLRQRPEGLANSLRGLGTGMQPSLWNQLQEMQVPTLLITGVDDQKFTGIAQAMQHEIPGAVHEIIPGSGHNVHMENPALFQRTVVQFLTHGGILNKQAWKL